MKKNALVRRTSGLFVVLLLSFAPQLHAQHLQLPTAEQHREMDDGYKKYKDVKSDYDKALEEYDKAGKGDKEAAQKKLDKSKKELQKAGQALLDLVDRYWIVDPPGYKPVYKPGGRYWGGTERKDPAKSDKETKTEIGDLAFGSIGLLVHVKLHEKVHWRQCLDHGDAPGTWVYCSKQYHKDEVEAYRVNNEQDVEFKLFSKEEKAGKEKVLDWHKKMLKAAG